MADSYRSVLKTNAMKWASGATTRKATTTTTGTLPRKSSSVRGKICIASKVTAFLDNYPNGDVEISAAVQDLGRAPILIRKSFLKYQDRILFASDGNPGRGAVAVRA